MLPRWHILFGAIFAAVIWILVPSLPFIYVLLVFASSVLIDFDHYVNAVIAKRDLSLTVAFRHHDKLIKIEEAEKRKRIFRKGDFHLFHTIEFHLLVGLIGIFWAPFFYIFIGMVFHSLLDVIHLMYRGMLYRREFFLFKWLMKDED